MRILFVIVLMMYNVLCIQMRVLFLLVVTRRVRVQSSDPNFARRLRDFRYEISTRRAKFESDSCIIKITPRAYYLIKDFTVSENYQTDEFCTANNDNFNELANYCFLKSCADIFCLSWRGMCVPIYKNLFRNERWHSREREAVLE